MQSVSRLAPFLLLLFTGMLSHAAIVPFMPFFMVNGLDQPAWMLSVYTGMVVTLSLLLNRIFARRIDRGLPVFPLIGAAIAGYATASLSMLLAPTLPVMLTLAVAGYGLSATAISAMFSTGGHLAERHGIARPTFNAWMRVMTSTGWMIGPAVSFTVFGSFGAQAVFTVACALSVVWAAAWWISLPRDIAAPAPPKATADMATAPTALWLAAAFVFSLSIAHGLTTSALPLYLVEEVGLPGFAPGAAFTVKTIAQVAAISTTAVLIARFGMRAPLMGCTGLAILAILIHASVQSLPQLALGSAIEGLYYGLFASLGISYIQSFAQDRPAQATAIYWNTLMISNLLAAPAVGLIAQVSDFRSAILIASGVAALAALVLLAGILHARATREAG